MKLKLTPKVFFFIMTGTLALLIVGGGAALYFANGLMQKHSKDVVALKLQNQTLDAQVNAYRSAQADLKKYQDLEDLVTRVVPTEKDQARVVREIVTLAKQNGINISSISFPASTLGAPAPKGAAAAPATPGTTTAPAAPPISQAKPVVGLNGVYSIQTTVTPLADKDHIVTYAQLISFLNKLELNRRTMQITNLQVTPQGISTSSGITFTLTLNIFVKP